MNQILLRADGNNEIGFGHVIRSLALGSILSSEFKCTLVTTSRNEWILEATKESGVGIHYLQEETHFDELIEILRPNDTVVLDNYFFGVEYQECLRLKGIKVICIDDVADKDFACDMIINHNPGITKKDYHANHNPEMLLGLNYVLLRREFLERAKTDGHPTKSNRRALICFGGADISNLTVKALNDLLPFKLDKIEIVIGPQYIYHKQLTDIIKYHQNIHLHQGIGVSQMIEVIEGVDFGIVPASSIIWEMLSMNKPVITGYSANNQLRNIQFLSNEIPEFILGDFSKPITSEIYDGIKNYPDQLFSYIDGLSDVRLLNAIKKLVCSD